MAGIKRYSIGAMLVMFERPLRRLVILSIKLDVTVDARAPTMAAMKASPA